MISYYELLGMIKEDKAPNKIRVHLNSQPRIYGAEYDCGDFSYYWLAEEKEDTDYHYYLAECFLESSMFEKNIEILEEEKKIEKLDFYEVNGGGDEFDKFYLKNNGQDIFLCTDDDDFEIIVLKKINEIIDYLKSKGDE